MVLSVAAQPRAFRAYADNNGKFSYYVCQSVTKRGSGARNASRLNARRFEELVVGKIRGNVLTESNIRASVRPVSRAARRCTAAVSKFRENVRISVQQKCHSVNKVYHRGGGIVSHRHDEKELNWEPGRVR